MIQDHIFIWYGLYYDNYDGETFTSTTDSAWKFIDRTRTFDEGTTICYYYYGKVLILQTPSNSKGLYLM